MHEDVTPPASTEEWQYRTVEFTDGLLIFDRRNTAGWLHSDLCVSLSEIR